MGKGIFPVESAPHPEKTDPQADISALKTGIDQMVYKLYDLTPEEIKIVEGENE